jgi:hypothetical protein
MLSNLIYVGCVGIWILAGYTAFFTPVGSDWRRLLDLVSLILLIVVMVVARPIDAKGWEPPTFGTRPLRLALYWTILVAGLGADLEWSWTQRPDGVGCHSSATLLLAAFFISPLLTLEGQARSRERAERA